MKSLAKYILCLALTISIIFIGYGHLFSKGTPYNTTITNRAVVDGDNLSAPITNTKTTNVQRIIGASWSGGADVLSASGSEIVNLVTHFTNVGNDSDVQWVFGVMDTNYSGAGLGTIPWTWVLLTNDVVARTQNNGALNVTAFTLIMASADVDKITFRVYVDGSASSGTAGWQLSATNITGGRNKVIYESDPTGSGIYFGGAANIGFGENTTNRVDLYSLGALSYYYEITVSPPNIHITKLIAGIGMNDANGPQGIAVPGASITNLIYVSNVGSINATGIVVRDYWDRSFITNGNMSVITQSDLADIWNESTNYGATSYVQWSNSNDGDLQASDWVHFKFITVIK